MTKRIIIATNADGLRRPSKFRLIDGIDVVEAVASDGTEYCINLRRVKKA